MTDIVVVRGLSKDYRVAVRPPGVWQAFRSVFSRTYKTVVAIRDLSFSIGENESVGFLGPNGAGKTTTLKMLSGLLTPTSGEIRVLGFVPHERNESYLRSITLVMGQKNQLVWDLPAADSFEFQRVIYGISDDAYRRQLGELTELFRLGSLLEKPVRQLSLGERMRCELSLSLLHEPRVLFLDEPTIGLDFAMKSDVRRYLAEYRKKHGAVFLLTSHDIDDITALCSRVIAIDKGSLRFDGSVEELARKHNQDQIVTLRAKRLPDDLPFASYGTVVSKTEEQVVLRIAREKVSSVIATLSNLLSIVDLTVENPPLEDAMADLFGRRENDEHQENPEVARS